MRCVLEDVWQPCGYAADVVWCREVCGRRLTCWKRSFVSAHSTWSRCTPWYAHAL